MNNNEESIHCSPDILPSVELSEDCILPSVESSEDCATFVSHHCEAEYHAPINSISCSYINIISMQNDMKKLADI